MDPTGLLAPAMRAYWTSEPPGHTRGVEPRHDAAFRTRALIAGVRFALEAAQTIIEECQTIPFRLGLAYDDIKVLTNRLESSGLPTLTTATPRVMVDFTCGKYSKWGGRPMSRTVVVVLVLGLVFDAGTVAASDAGEVLYACAKSSNGQMRLVDDPSGCLPSKEDAVMWNVRGPQGIQGEPGPAGPPGDFETYEIRTGPVNPGGPVRTAASATCNAGDTLVNGGYSLSPNVAVDFSVVDPPIVMASHPAYIPTQDRWQWQVTTVDGDEDPGLWTLWVFAHCAP